MPWLQLETKSGYKEPAALEALLEELGAVAITLHDAADEPLLEPAPGETPLWSSTRVTALFPADTEATLLSARLAALIDADQLIFTRLADTDWQLNWQQALKPQHYGARLWVLPHDEAHAPANSAVVRLEPGLAFGSGEHPTTAMCLEWLEESVRPSDRVLDYGCGSGLLGIAALALGADSVWATDIDNQALDATVNNANNNGCGDRLRAVHPELVDNSQHFDLLVANILSGTLMELGATIEPLMRLEARLALSGILAEQADSVIAAWSPWADMKISKHSGPWVLLTGRKARC